MSEWKPIESAPKDGTRILIALDGVNRSMVGLWNGAEWKTIDGNNWDGRTITHWQPLPLPPLGEKDDH